MSINNKQVSHTFNSKPTVAPDMSHTTHAVQFFHKIFNVSKITIINGKIINYSAKCNSVIFEKLMWYLTLCRYKVTILYYFAFLTSLNNCRHWMFIST